jgi:hypothetical protein
MNHEYNYVKCSNVIAHVLQNISRINESKLKGAMIFIAAIPIGCKVANKKTRGPSKILKGSQRMRGRRNFLKISAPHPLNRTFRMSPDPSRWTRTVPVLAKLNSWPLHIFIWSIYYSKLKGGNGIFSANCPRQPVFCARILFIKMARIPEECKLQT